MRISLISPSYYPDETGIADGSRMLANSLAEQGDHADVQVFARRGHGQGIHAGCTKTVSVRRVMQRCDWRGLRALILTLSDARPRIVHIEYQESDFEHHQMVLNLPAAIRRALPGSLVFMRMHDLIVPSGIPKWRHLLAGFSQTPWQRLGPKTTDYRILSRMLKPVDGVIVCNPRDKRILEDRVLPFWVNGSRPEVRIIPIGTNIPLVPISSQEVRKYRQRLGWSAGDMVLVCFGFIQEAKGVGDLLAMFEHLARGNARVRLLILGAAPSWEPEYANNYQSLIDAMQHSGRVVWKRYLPHEEVSAWLQCSDLAVLPFQQGASLNRGTLVACIDHGLPVLTTQSHTAIGGPFEDGENILLARSGDLGDLLRKAEKLTRDRNLLSRLSSRTRMAARYFAWSEVGRAHLDFYRSHKAKDSPHPSGRRERGRRNEIC